MNVPAIFGEDTFNLQEMQKRLPEDVFEKLNQTMKEGQLIDPSIVDIIANTMKEWALERGATHYTHWFQPMHEGTAEKHESFISPTQNGNIKMDFSGKMLIKGEADASSFPNGGMRTTAQARGYTVWDCTSFAFIKNKTLCIPAIFISYTGEVLDKKTPLLKSMDALNKQALRLLKVLGKECKRVITTVGAEQEYFLIDIDKFHARRDLSITGRTLYGASLIKGQQLENNYYAALQPRIDAFMAELDEKLWRLGILAKTKHCEVAPCQFEIAPIFSIANVATDHNQILMEVLKEIAEKHHFACLLHEKPFQGLNGSGKHNNWSLCTDNGENLLDPTENPAENLQFLLFLVAIIQAVDVHQDLLRISSASASNDHRLGGQEAPPAIVTIFLGEALTNILELLGKGEKSTSQKETMLKMGVDVLPDIVQDTTDRNRTSSFAFTGNKFEFRMLGSAFSIADTNVYLNAAVADVLKEFADCLEKAKNIEKTAYDIIQKTIQKHQKIIFNGDNYAAVWKEKARQQGFCNFVNTAQALKHLTDKKNIQLFTEHCILSKDALIAREEILREKYCNEILIEAKTMLSMFIQQIYPAINNYIGHLLAIYEKQKVLSIETPYLKESIQELVAQNECAAMAGKELNEKIAVAENENDYCKKADICAEEITVKMQNLRILVDAMESSTAREFWPFPTYEDILTL